MSPTHRLPRTVISGVSALALASVIALALSSPAFAAMPTAPSTTGLTGARPGATQIPFQITDEVTARVDVGSGNLSVASQTLNLPGVNQGVQIGQVYNTFSTAAGSTSTPAANKWTLNVANAGYLTTGSSGAIVYIAGDGSSWPFTPISGAPGTYTSPAGLKRDLTLSGTVYTLTDRTSRQVISFNTDGLATTIADRNGNATVISYAGTTPTKVTSTAGPTAARAATLSYSSSTYKFTATQTSGSLSRHVDWTKDSSSNLISIVDAENKATTFGYASGKLTTLTSPAGGTITFGYDTSDRVISVARSNTSTGSPGTSITRFAYPSTTQTLLARPNTNQSAAVAAVPHITYTLDSNKRVTASVDELNRSRSATYTPQSDTASSTIGTGAAAGTTTNGWAANGGDSQTSAQSPGGSTTSLAYSNTALASKYLPSSGSDESGHTTNYTYNGSGNPLTTSSALASTATLTYNSNGTVATALAPGNGSNVTTYSYNANSQLQSITPVTGSSLGTRNLTYDDFGRITTMTDGRSGNLATFGYDKQDRVTSISYSGGPSITNTWDSAGRILTRVDPNGTTTWTYDQVGRLLSRGNTYAGGTITYGYDKSSDLTSVTDGRGTITYAFDDSGVLAQLSYGSVTGTRLVNFATDDQGRRTDTWLDTNADNSQWFAHYHQDYDRSGRLTHYYGDKGVGDRRVERTYCYSAGSVAPACGTATTSDRSKLVWEIDNVQHQTTTYTYDNDGRLASSVEDQGFPHNQPYTYDARGNLLTQGPGASQITYNPANQITSDASSSGYQYDGAGNLLSTPTESHTYNAAGQMVSTSGSTPETTAYAGVGQSEVIKIQGNSDTYQYVYGRNSAAGAPTLEQMIINGTRHVYIDNDPVTGQPLLVRGSSGSPGDIYLFVYGRSGSVEGTLAGNDYSSKDYWPRGQDASSYSTVSNGQENPFGFQGGIRDQVTKLVHFGARWYDPYRASWTQQDTIDSPLDPSNANRYAFAAGDPVNNTDPSGSLSRRAYCKIYQYAGAISSVAAVGVGVYTVSTLPADAVPVAGQANTAIAGGITLTLGASAALFGLASAIAC